ncbi:MAG TPA: nickel pincer cofactor biosynthesis protein LarC [Methanocella sp.]|nr:nickel pincer cofactor biosynthesis protein LarC [Methanocella sp.]
MKILYLDCFSGISGDMFLGAMVDLEVMDIDTLSTGLSGLGLDIRVRAKKVSRHGLVGTKVDVIVPDTAEERHLEEIMKIIGDSRLPEDIKATSGHIFARLARAESKIHGVPVEEVHFHEVGALDTIADVVGAAMCYRASGAGALYASPLNVGGGLVRTSHGVLPVPAPATLELLSGAPVYATGTEAELVTPTGAAVLSELCTGYGPMPPMRIEKTGYGAGSKDLGTPNLLRAVLGEIHEGAPAPKKH